MTKKIPKNFYIPEPVYEAFLEIAGTVNEKQQWAVISAAVMALVEAGPRGQELIDLAMSADRRDDFASVLNDLRPEPLQLNTAAACTITFDILSWSDATPAKVREYLSTPAR